MKPAHIPNSPLRRAVAASLSFAAACSIAAASGETQSSGTQTEQTQDKVTVESYETRPAPTHEVSLQDGRVYFLKDLEETDSGYVLHTLEDETIQVNEGEVAEIKKLK